MMGIDLALEPQLREYYKHLYVQCSQATLHNDNN